MKRYKRHVRLRKGERCPDCNWVAPWKCREHDCLVVEPESPRQPFYQLGGSITYRWDGMTYREAPNDYKVQEFSQSISFAKLLAPDLMKVYGDAMPYPWHPDSEMPHDKKKYGLIGPVTCIRETERALCLRYTPPGKFLEPKEFWVPKSQLHPEENEVAAVGDEGMLVVAEWILNEKGLL